MNDSNLWLYSNQEKLESLLADEAKNSHMLTAMLNTIRQLQAKSSFRIALLNQLIEDQYENNRTEKIHRPKE